MMPRNASLLKQDRASFEKQWSAVEPLDLAGAAQVIRLRKIFRVLTLLLAAALLFAGAGANRSYACSQTAF